MLAGPFKQTRVRGAGGIKLQCFIHRNYTGQHSMEQQAFKNENNCLNTNTYSYLETSGGQSSTLYLNVHFFNTSVI